MTVQSFACKCGCGFATVDAVLLQILEHVRLKYNAPVKITSGCRCPEHNKAVGGSENSQHLQGRAADFTVHNVPAREVYTWLNETYPYRFGMGKYGSWTHIDSRNYKARWEG